MNGKSSQQESNRSQFARVLGMAPCVSSARCSTVAELDLFAESFGPPEVKKQPSGAKVIYWNFVRADGTAGFSLFSKITNLQPKEVEVRLAANAGAKGFREWTAVRLHEISHAEALPLFLGVNAKRFCIARLGA